MKGKLQLSDDSAACAICPTEVLGTDQYPLLGNQILNYAFYPTSLCVLVETQQLCVKSVLEAVLRRIPDKDGFQSTLR